MPSNDYDKERLLNEQDTDSELDNGFEEHNTRSRRGSWQERPSTSWETLSILILTIVISNICTGVFVVSKLKSNSNTGSNTAVLPKAHKVNTEEEDPPTIRTISTTGIITLLANSIAQRELKNCQQHTLGSNGGQLGAWRLARQTTRISLPHMSRTNCGKVSCLRMV